MNFQHFLACVVAAGVFFSALLCDGLLPIGSLSVTRRNFPFVDASRCRLEEYCKISPEWDLSFGRPIPATTYFPGNATHTNTNVGFPMSVLIFAAIKSNDEFHQMLTNISSAGVVVISLHLEGKMFAFDYIQDILRVAFDMYYENENSYSHFYQQLSGKIIIAGFGQIANDILWINYYQNFVHSSIKAIVSLSPSVWTMSQQIHPLLYSAAKSIRVPNVLFIGGTSDAWRPISHQRPIYNQIRAGFPANGGVCKTYIELNGGNHCFFLDINGSETAEMETECYQKEMEYPSFKSAAMTHEYQLLTYGAPLFVQYIQWINNVSNDTSMHFRQYLNDIRDHDSDLNYLQSCYVYDQNSAQYLSFAHDSYFPVNDEMPIYRSIQ